MLALRRDQEAQPKEEVPDTALGGFYRYALRLRKDESVEKVFEYQRGGYYQAQDGEIIPIYIVQRIRWKQSGGEGYILSNQTTPTLRERYNETLKQPFTRRIIVALATLKKH